MRFKEPTFIQSVLPIFLMFITVMIGRVYLGYPIEPMILLAAVFAGFMAWYLQCDWSVLESAILGKIDVAMGGMLIIFSIGSMVGTWMFCGTVPYMVYLGIQIVNPEYMLLSAFIVCTIVSVCTGTSWGSAATIGVAMIGIAHGLGLPLAPVAGAALSGCYIGDKMSPLSDTTNLAPAVSGAELYEHIRHMCYTTIPGIILCLIVYTVFGEGASEKMSTPQEIQLLLDQLSDIYNWNILLLLPPLILITGSVLKWPVLPTIILTSIFSLLLGLGLQDNLEIRDGIIATVSGFKVSMLGYEGEVLPAVEKLINRGGMMSVMENMAILCCAMAFGGIMQGSGMLEVVLKKMLTRVKTDAGLIITTLASCFTLCFSTGSAYLGILIPGALFKNTFLERQLHPKNLSRALEDSATLMDCAIPWASGAIYMSSVLGVSSFDFLPWLVFNVSSIFIAAISALLGIGIVKISKDEAERRLNESHEC